MEKNSKYPRRRRNLEIHRLTIEQIKQLLEATQEHVLKALLTVAITTGLRRGELLGLRWEDIDIQNEILYVRRMVSSIGDRESTETARTIALPTRALDALKEHQHHQNEARTKVGETWHNLDLVFQMKSASPSIQQNSSNSIICSLWIWGYHRCVFTIYAVVPSSFSS